MSKDVNVDAGVNSVFNTGGSLGVILPKKFTDVMDIRKGDPLPWVIIGDTIRFIPMDKDNKVIQTLRKSQVTVDNTTPTE